MITNQAELVLQYNNQQNAMNQFQQQHYQQQQIMSQRVYDPMTDSYVSSPQTKKEVKKMNTSYIREYFVKHRELLMGLAIFILLDHYIFEGAFREKIKRIVHSILDRAENKLVPTIEDKT